MSHRHLGFIFKLVLHIYMHIYYVLMSKQSIRSSSSWWGARCWSCKGRHYQIPILYASSSKQQRALLLSLVSTAKMLWHKGWMWGQVRVFKSLLMTAHPFSNCMICAIHKAVHGGLKTIVAHINCVLRFDCDNNNNKKKKLYTCSVFTFGMPHFIGSSKVVLFHCFYRCHIR